jgi:starch-binding outer membrane protein, SusD/RagB family
MRYKYSLRDRRLTPARLAAAGLLALFAACNSDKLLKVTDPDVARPDALQGAGALPAQRAGAVGNFGVAFNGGAADVEQVHLSALLSDEFINTETFPTRIEIDQRAMTLPNTSLIGTFFDLTRARSFADLAIDNYRLSAKTAGDSAGFPEVLALSGLSYILFAENYCGGVPISKANADGSFTFGAAESTNTLLDSAVSKFNQALAVPQATILTATFKQLAQVGKGRALLDQGKYPEAALAVAGVLTTFQYNYTHSETTARQNNGTWSLTSSVARFGEADAEAGVGLPYQSDGNLKKTTGLVDPRVADSVANRAGQGNKGFDGTTIQWVQAKYPLRSSVVTIADGVEARLIEAEASLNAGDAAGALTTLNALRSNAALLALRGYGATSLPPLTLQATAATQQNQLFKERAYWLFLTSHRLGDLRRLIRQYTRPVNTVFPNGAYFKGGLYGTDVNVPVPFQEQNNPQYDKTACKQDVA